MDKDRRKAPRAPSELTIDLYDAKGHAVKAEGRFINLSTIGALLETPKPYKLSERLRLRFQPGKEPLLDVSGKIIWAHPYRRRYRYGVVFDSASSAQRLKSRHS
jgi:hypothetical protein